MLSGNTNSQFWERLTQKNNFWSRIAPQQEWRPVRSVVQSNPSFVWSRPPMDWLQKDRHRDRGRQPRSWWRSVPSIPDVSVGTSAIIPGWWLSPGRTTSTLSRTREASLPVLTPAGTCWVFAVWNSRQFSRGTEDPSDRMMFSRSESSLDWYQ